MIRSCDNDSCNTLHVQVFGDIASMVAIKYEHTNNICAFIVCYLNIHTVYNSVVSLYHSPSMTDAMFYQWQKWNAIWSDIFDLSIHFYHNKILFKKIFTANYFHQVDRSHYYNLMILSEGMQLSVILFGFYICCV